jgi:uncharacterized protein (DUF111 family)
MQTEGLLLLCQVDHLSGEEIGWMFDSLAIPGVRNRSLVPTLTKKGRVGHLLILDIDPAVEEEIAKLLFECLAIHGYHRMASTHVYQKTHMRNIDVTVKKGNKEISGNIRMKEPVVGHVERSCFESDDLFSLLQHVYNELGAAMSPMELKSKIEAESTAQNDRISISL